MEIQSLNQRDWVEERKGRPELLVPNVELKTYKGVGKKLHGAGVVVFDSIGEEDIEVQGIFASLHVPGNIDSVANADCARAPTVSVVFPRSVLRAYRVLSAVISPRVDRIDLAIDRDVMPHLAKLSTVLGIAEGVAGCCEVGFDFSKLNVR